MIILGAEPGAPGGGGRGPGVLELGQQEGRDRGAVSAPGGQGTMRAHCLPVTSQKCK